MTTPTGYIGCDTANKARALYSGAEPAEIAEAKNTVQNVIDAWEAGGGFRSASEEGCVDSVGLAEDIVNKLLDLGALFPETPREKAENPFADFDGKLISADFALMRSPGGYRYGSVSNGWPAPAAVVTPGQHTLFAGPTGCGKSIALNNVAYSAYAQENDVTVIDLVKDGADWSWMRSDASVISLPSGATDVLRDHLEENNRVSGVLSRNGHSSFWELDATFRQENGLRPRLLVLDSVLDLVALIERPSQGYGARTARRFVYEMVGQPSSKTGLTVIASIQGPVDRLESLMQEQFTSKLFLGAEALGQAELDNHSTPQVIPAGVGYLRPGEIGVQVWHTDHSSLAEALPAAREACNR